MSRQNQFSSGKVLQNMTNLWEHPSNGNANKNGTEMMFEESSNAEQKLNMKKRMKITERQWIILEDEFAKNRYITKRRRIEIAEEVNMTSVQVRIWFVNRRIKEKKQLKENQQKNESQAMNQSLTSTIIHPGYLTTRYQPEISTTRIELQTPTTIIQPQNSMTTNGSDLYSAQNQTDFWNLPYLTQQSNYCGYWGHDLSCRCTRMNFNQPETMSATSCIGSTNSICDGCSHYVPSIDYEHDFFSDYS